MSQHHHSDPFVHPKLAESTKPPRRGSAPLVGMGHCRIHCKKVNLSLGGSYIYADEKDSTNSLDSPVSKNHPLLSPVRTSPLQSHNESAFSHLNSPRPATLQPHSPQPQHHCRACMSLFRGWTKGGQSVGHTPSQGLSACIQGPSSLLMPTATQTYSNCAALSSDTRYVCSCSVSPSSQPQSKRLFEGGDLTLLNHCLHRIVGRRISSPALRITGASCQSSRQTEHTARCDESQDMDLSLPLLSDLCRNPQFSLENEDRPDSLVCQRTTYP